MSAVLLRSVAVERRPIIGWLVGIALLVLITTGSWPAVEDSADDFSAVLENMPAALTAFLGEGIANFSAAGLVGSRLFGTVGLAAMIGFGVSRGARSIAGEEGAGTLEHLVTQPLSRTDIAAAKATSMWGVLAGLMLWELALLLISMPLFGLEFPLGDVLMAGLGLYGMAAMFGSLAFAVGAATGSRGLAVGVGAGVAGAMFVLGGLGALVEGLEPLAENSPFRLYDGSRVLAEGLSLGVPLAFVGIAVVLVALGIVAFGRRDLS